MAAKESINLARSVVTLVTVLVVMVAGYLAWQGLKPEDPFSLNDEYRITVDANELTEESMTITNNSTVDLKIHVFNASDGVKVIAADEFIIPSGKNKTGYERAPYVFNVWKSQFFDAHIRWSDELWGDVVFTGDDSNLVIASDPPTTTFTNEVDEHLKLCTYNDDDALQWIELMCWTLAPGQAEPIRWETAPATFAIRVFRPAFLDDPLAVRDQVSAASSVTIEKTS